MRAVESGAVVVVTALHGTLTVVNWLYSHEKRANGTSCAGLRSRRSRSALSCSSSLRVASSLVQSERSSGSREEQPRPTALQWASWANNGLEAGSVVRRAALYGPTGTARCTQLAPLSLPTHPAKPARPSQRLTSFNLSPASYFTSCCVIAAAHLDYTYQLSVSSTITSHTPQRRSSIKSELLIAQRR